MKKTKRRPRALRAGQPILSDFDIKWRRVRGDLADLAREACEAGRPEAAVLLQCERLLGRHQAVAEAGRQGMPYLGGDHART